MRDKAGKIPVARDPGAAGGNSDGRVLSVSDYFSSRALCTAQPTGVRPRIIFGVNVTAISARENIVNKSQRCGHWRWPAGHFRLGDDAHETHRHQRTERKRPRIIDHRIPPLEIRCVEWGIRAMRINENIDVGHQHGQYPRRA